MANNPIGWFEIYVQDMNRAKGFYESVFATRLERLESPSIEMWAFSMNPGQPGAPGLSRQDGGLSVRRQQHHCLLHLLRLFD